MSMSLYFRYLTYCHFTITAVAKIRIFFDIVAFYDEVLYKYSENKPIEIGLVGMKPERICVIDCLIVTILREWRRR